jgi:hypothetical protein
MRCWIGSADSRVTRVYSGAGQTLTARLFRRRLGRDCETAGEKREDQRAQAPRQAVARHRSPEAQLWAVRGSPAVAGIVERELEVGARQQQVAGSLRPLDEADPFSFEVIGQARVCKLTLINETIKIKVVQV